MKKDNTIITYENKDTYYHNNETITTFDRVTTFLVSTIFLLFGGGVLYANLINNKISPALFSLMVLPFVIFLVAYIFIDANNNNVTNLD